MSGATATAADETCCAEQRDGAGGWDVSEVGHSRRAWLGRVDADRDAGDRREVDPLHRAQIDRVHAGNRVIEYVRGVAAAGGLEFEEEAELTIRRNVRIQVEREGVAGEVLRATRVVQARNLTTATSVSESRRSAADGSRASATTVVVGESCPRPGCTEDRLRRCRTCPIDAGAKNRAIRLALRDSETVEGDRGIRRADASHRQNH